MLTTFLVDLAAPAFYKLLYMSVTAFVVCMIIMLIRRFADKQLSPFWKYAMWILVLVALIIPWRPQSNLSVMNTTDKIQDVSFYKEYSNAQIEYSNAQRIYNTALQKEPASGSLIHEQSERLADAKAKADSLHIKTLIFDYFLPALWLVGVAVIGLFMLISSLRLIRLIKNTELSFETERYENILQRCKQKLGINRKVHLVQQTYVKTPALFGLFRPKIILPDYMESMSDKHIEYIILHELSHLKRGDGGVNTLLLVLQVVYWFNPLTWFMFRFIREDMEIANDAAVLNGMGTDEQKEYCLSLVAVLSGYNKSALMPRLLCMVDHEKNMERRINMIKLGEFFKKRKLIIAIQGMLIIALTATLFLTGRIGGATEPNSADSSGDSKIEEPKSDFSDEYAAEIKLLKDAEQFIEETFWTNHCQYEDYEGGNKLAIEIDNQYYAPVTPDFAYNSTDELRAALQEYFTDKYINESSLMEIFIDNNGMLYQDAYIGYGDVPLKLWDTLKYSLISQSGNAIVIDRGMYTKPISNLTWYTARYTIMDGKINAKENLDHVQLETDAFYGYWANFDEKGNFQTGYYFAEDGTAVRWSASSPDPIKYSIYDYGGYRGEHDNTDGYLHLGYVFDETPDGYEKLEKDKDAHSLGIISFSNVKDYFIVRSDWYVDNGKEHIIDTKYDKVESISVKDGVVIVTGGVSGIEADRQDPKLPIVSDEGEIVEKILVYELMTDEQFVELVESGEIPQNVTHLYLDGNEISDISILSRFTSLIELSLYRNPISDISPLIGLTNLKVLNLNGAGPYDPAPLGELTNLNYLSLSRSGFDDLTPLSGLKNLESLIIYNGNVSDLTPSASVSEI